MLAMGDSHGQQQAAIRLDWGPAGAAAIGTGADYAIVVDILSFSTTVSVALDRGAEVFPFRWRDASAAAFAREHDATLAVGRPEAAGSDQGNDQGNVQRAADLQADGQPAQARVSLSPASVRSATGLRRLVLPSPNGSALSAGLAHGQTAVLTAAFRNRTAVARWLTSRNLRPPDSTRLPVIGIVAAGEHWPDGSLRPAIEDFWGAGALVAALSARGFADLSPEAAAAAAAFTAVEPRLPAELAATVSGRELASLGFALDLAIAAELDTSATVPLLSGNRYTDAAGNTGDQADRCEYRA